MLGSKFPPFPLMADDLHITSVILPLTLFHFALPDPGGSGELEVVVSEVFMNLVSTSSISL